MEIRSYRNVFEVERRIYRIDRLRLNPAGVPLRAIGCYALLALAGVIVGKLPLLSSVTRIAPWYVRLLLVPAASSAALTAVRLDGRPAHVTIAALLRFAAGPRSLTALRPPCRSLGRRVFPGAILLLADGSHQALRRLRYTGPGTVRVAAAHVLAQRGARTIEMRSTRAGRPTRDAPSAGARRLTSPARIVSLRSGARLEVRP